MAAEGGLAGGNAVMQTVDGHRFQIDAEASTCDRQHYMTPGRLEVTASSYLLLPRPTARVSALPQPAVRPLACSCILHPAPPLAPPPPPLPPPVLVMALVANQSRTVSKLNRAIDGPPPQPSWGSNRSSSRLLLGAGRVQPDGELSRLEHQLDSLAASLRPCPSHLQRQPNSLCTLLGCLQGPLRTLTDLCVGACAAPSWTTHAARDGECASIPSISEND